MSKQKEIHTINMTDQGILKEIKRDILQLIGMMYQMQQRETIKIYFIYQ